MKVKSESEVVILDAWGWCTGTTQKDGMGREEGGGFRMGNTCIHCCLVTELCLTLCDPMG